MWCSRAPSTNGTERTPDCSTADCTSSAWWLSFPDCNIWSNTASHLLQMIWVNKDSCHCTTLMASLLTVATKIHLLTDFFTIVYERLLKFCLCSVWPLAAPLPHKCPHRQHKCWFWCCSLLAAGGGKGSEPRHPGGPSEEVDPSINPSQSCGWVSPAVERQWCHLS